MRWSRNQPSGWDSSRVVCSFSDEISSTAINSLSREPTNLCQKGEENQVNL